MARFSATPGKPDVSECGIHSAGIDDNNANTGARTRLWQDRIQCHGQTAQEASELRDFVLTAIIRYQAFLAKE